MYTPENMSLWQRDAISDIKSMPSTLSSWDSCMAKTYCKWPVIAGIIVGSVIVLSLLGCLISCVCCGVTCCKSCCGCCSSCCPSGGRKRSKHADDPSSYHQPPPPQPFNQGYKSSPAPPVYAPVSQDPPNTHIDTSQSAPYRGLQTAQFDTPTKAKIENEDALPPMPSWSTAATRRVEDHSPAEDVELGRLDTNGQQLGHGAGSPGGQPTRNGQGYAELPTDSMSPHQRGPGSLFGAPGPYGSGPAGAAGTAYGQTMRSQSPYQRAPTANTFTSQYSRATDMAPLPGGGYHDSSPTSPRVPRLPVGPYDRAPTANTFTSQYSRATDGYYPPHTTSPPPVHRMDSYRSQSPHTPYGQAPPPQRTYSPYSPTIPSSPPPPFSAVPQDPSHTIDSGARPPSLLQAGRKPLANSWRDV